MNCSRFAGVLADFEQGKLSFAERSAAEAHLEQCSGCRRLLDAARGTIDLLSEDGRDALTRSILARTSGSVCPRVESCLWEYNEDRLDAEESRLIKLHLEHCPACKSLAGELAAAQQILPEMAEIEPGGSFTREVVGLTSQWRPYRSSLKTRFLAWWGRMVYRPRFALEAAYLGTLILVILYCSPFLPFRNATFEKATSAAVQPVSGGLNKIMMAVTLENHAAYNTLSGLARNCELFSTSIAVRSSRGIREWQRKETEALATVWTQLAGLIPPAGR